MGVFSGESACPCCNTARERNGMCLHLPNMIERRNSGWNHDGLQTSKVGTAMKKLMILGAVLGAIALFVFARQSSAKESNEAEIRAMEAAMIEAYAAKDLDK